MAHICGFPQLQRINMFIILYFNNWQHRSIYDNIIVMKDLNYYLKLKYDVKLIGCSGFWAAAIHILPDCAAEGKTPDEVMAKLEEKKKIWIEDALKAGRPIPEP